jgi:type I restriction enzyme S subunit
MAKKSPRVPASPRESENEDGNPGLVPKLRFPEFVDNSGWIERRLGDFLSESRLPGSKGNVAKKITVKLWGNGVFEKNDTIQGSINTQYFRRKAGQFIYSKLDFLNQAFGIIPPCLDNFESTVDLPCFDCADGLNTVFLLEYVKRKDFYERLGETADGSRKARRIHAETFLSFPIALPSEAEQHKIASCLSSLDELIGAQGRKVDALRTHKKGLMQQLFPREGETQPRLRFPEFQDAGDWEEHELGLKVDLLSGYPFDGPDISQDSTGIPLLRGINVTEGRIRHNTEMDRYFTGSTKGLEKYRLRTNDLVIGMDGSKVGKNSALISNADADALLIQRVARLRASNPSLIQFIFYRIHSPTFHSYVDRINTSSGIPHISAKQIKEFRIAFPSEAEQQRIATCLSSLDDLITAGTQKLEALKTHKRGLMQQLFPSPEEN